MAVRKIGFVLHQAAKSLVPSLSSNVTSESGPHWSLARRYTSSPTCRLLLPQFAPGVLSVDSILFAPIALSQPAVREVLPPTWTRPAANREQQIFFCKNLANHALPCNSALPTVSSMNHHSPLLPPLGSSPQIVCGANEGLRHPSLHSPRCN